MSRKMRGPARVDTHTQARTLRYMTLPRIFVLGDSISIQYGPYLERLLAGRVAYARKDGTEAALADLDVPAGANGGDSGMCLRYLRQRCAEPDFRPDLLLLNCGLHDIKRSDPFERCQVDADTYRDNVIAIRNLVREAKIPLGWLRTTPVVDTIHNTRSKSFHRHAADNAAYAGIADTVMANAEHRIDLHAATKALGGDEIFCDHVHFVEPVRQAQAAFIAGHLCAWLAHI